MPEVRHVYHVPTIPRRFLPRNILEEEIAHAVVDRLAVAELIPLHGVRMSADDRVRTETDNSAVPFARQGRGERIVLRAAVEYDDHVPRYHPFRADPIAEPLYGKACRARFFRHCDAELILAHRDHGHRYAVFRDPPRYIRFVDIGASTCMGDATAVQDVQCGKQRVVTVVTRVIVCKNGAVTPGNRQKRGVLRSAYDIRPAFFDWRTDTLRTERRLKIHDAVVRLPENGQQIFERRLCHRFIKLRLIFEAYVSGEEQFHGIPPVKVLIC